MKKIPFTHITRCFSLLVVLFLSTVGFSQTIKLGSVAPAQSPWDKALRTIAGQWQTASNGKVVLKIYSGGIAGGEEDMIRKMRIGQLDAAGFSGVGLSRIYTGVLAAQVPLLIRTDEELASVLEKMKPEFEQAFQKQGFKILLWSKVGWIHFFSKNPVIKPGDLMAHKLFNYAGDPDIAQAWKEAGFNPVSLQPSDIMTALQSGMINAFSTTPLTAAAYQWFTLTKNMCGMKWAPLLGGVVITTAAWNKIGADMQPKLLEIMSTGGKNMQVEIDSADNQAIRTMQQHGLMINAVSPTVETEWYNAVQGSFNKIIGKSIDSQSYETIQKILATVRKESAASATKK
ncbi:MAG: TRAP transporter substrate-binding protein DctP [Chitinivibrionales bacterium]|nr:TRAP transporter substrate-binding protein DctP [Chitinivibrionales bacterium]